jgi:putative endonuclease
VDGERYEREAEALLQAAGLLLVARNWHCRFGEIDLIMKDGATLVFVEVRKRGSERFGGAIASIGLQKQAKLRRAIEFYLSTLSRTPACRVDAVLFNGKADGAPHWQKNIFGE